jgi:hypothetical protein
MRRAVQACVVTAALAFVWAPAQARAEGYVSPWVAANAGAGFSNGNINFDNGRAGFGVNAGAMGNGIIGGEVDLGFNPSFFGTQNEFGSNSVIDLMGNVIIGVPIGGTHGGGLRPYFTAGLGLTHRQIDGGDLFAEHVGLRGDVRYLRTINASDASLSDPFNVSQGNFHYWRASAGVVIR